ncbi:MAG TPA: hypothetical protein VMU14_15950 [Acidimicrobiales bacterium]|nr:hypothetical protein [Acidimicrobiales bacterium]
MHEDTHLGPVSLIVAIAGGLVIGGLALAAAFWVLGAVAGILFGLLKLAVIVGLAALVVWGVRALFRDRDRV